MAGSQPSLLPYLHLSRSDVDEAAWNATIDLSARGLPYGYSWYLDAVCGGRWEALVDPDYRWVFPLPYNRKLLGIPQLYRPILWQQGGPYGATVHPAIVRTCLEAIPRKFRRIHLSLSHPVGELPGITPRLNLTLAPEADHAVRQGAYSKSLRKRLRRARNEGLVVSPGGRIEEVLALYRREIGARLTWSDGEYRKAQSLLEAAARRDRLLIRRVTTATGALLAGGCFLRGNDRLINLLGAATPAGRTAFATHLLLDDVVAYCGSQGWVFDFEGSELSGVAAFFRSFGAREEWYAAYTQSRLPGWAEYLLQMRKKS